MKIKIPLYMILKLQPLSYTIQEIHPTEFHFSFLDQEISEDFAVKREVLEYTFTAYQEDGETRDSALSVLPMAVCVTLTIHSKEEEIKDWIKNHKTELLICRLLQERLA